MTVIKNVLGKVFEQVDDIREKVFSGSCHVLLGIHATEGTGFKMGAYFTQA